MSISCPRARTTMTPCIARDGRVALADDDVCVGCAQDPDGLLAELSERYTPPGEPRHGTAAELADRLRDHVASYVDQRATEDRAPEADETAHETAHGGPNAR